MKIAIDYLLVFSHFWFATPQLVLQARIPASGQFGNISSTRQKFFLNAFGKDGLFGNVHPRAHHGDSRREHRLGGFGITDDIPFLSRPKKEASHKINFSRFFHGFRRSLYRCREIGKRTHRNNSQIFFIFFRALDYKIHRVVLLILPPQRLSRILTHGKKIIQTNDYPVRSAAIYGNFAVFFL